MNKQLRKADAVKNKSINKSGGVGNKLAEEFTLFTNPLA